MNQQQIKRLTIYQIEYERIKIPKDRKRMKKKMIKKEWERKKAREKRYKEDRKDQQAKKYHKIKVKK